VLEQRVTALVETLELDPRWSRVDATRGELAVQLARQLDDRGTPSYAFPGLARELRELLDDLAVLDTGGGRSISDELKQRRRQRHASDRDHPGVG